jgi:ATP/maltotriose-dependent transcriptional regulator MalT
VNLSQLNASRGWLELGIAQAERAAQIAPSDPRLRCHAMNRLARAQYALGDLVGAHGTSKAAVDLARASDLQVPLESAYRTLGEVEALQREWAAAQDHLRSAMAINQRTGSEERETVCVARLAELAMASGDMASAAALVESACAKSAQLPESIVKAVTHTVRGKVLLTEGRPDEALTDLLKAEEFFGKTRVWDEVAEVSLQLAKAHLRLGRLRFATLHCRAALDTVEQVASRLQSEEHRYLFTHDPRRAELYEVAATLRRAAERPADHPMDEGQGGD